MSLIQEALEKAAIMQGNQTAKRAVMEPTAPKLKPAAPRTPIMKMPEPKAPKAQAAPVLSQIKLPDLKLSGLNMAGLKISLPGLNKKYAIYAGLLALLMMAGILVRGRDTHSPAPAAARPAMKASAASWAEPSIEGSFILTGITDSSSGRLALINNQVYGAGDLIQDGVAIEQILERSVVLSSRGHKVELSL